MADALVARDDISELYCPVGGAATMSSVAGYLGKAATERDPEVAVVRCAGSCALRPDGTAVRALRNRFDGARSCAVEAATYAGETGCSFGCLGQGDCVAVCAFDAIGMNPATGLPEVDEAKCTACAKCVKACPKVVIELRRKGPKSRRVFVSCVNKDKGGVARKSCEVACIGCGKCVKVCTFEAITLDSNLAYIDPAKCKLCRKCVGECPTGSIIEVGFPPKKETATKE
jgi:ferredoxin